MGISVTDPVRRAIALALGVSLLAGVAAAPASAGVLPVNTVTLDGSAAAAHVGQSVTLNAAADGETATIELWDAVDGGAAVKVDEAAAVLDNTKYVAGFSVDGLTAGSHAFTAVTVAGSSYDTGTSDPWTVVVTRMPTQVDLVALTPPVGGISFGATVVLSETDPQGTPTGVTGEVTVKLGATTLDTCVPANGSCNVVLTLPAGIRTLDVSFAGDAKYAPSTHGVDWDIPANTVDASGVGLNRTTFYPARDGYKDTVTARGTRNEAASVTIKIYSPAGKRLKTVAIASGTGSYSYAWNGRNSSGTMYPAGKYKITQALNDGNMTATWTKYVNLSAKKLVTYTKTITKNYAHRAAQGTYSVAWSFTLPSATVYKKLVFSVYGKSKPDGGFGPHDFSDCSKSSWDINCLYPGKLIGSSFAWRSVTGNVSYNRSGTYTRLYAFALYRTNLKYGRVKVTYAVLK